MKSILSEIDREKSKKLKSLAAASGVVGAGVTGRHDIKAAYHDVKAKRAFKGGDLVDASKHLAKSIEAKDKSLIRRLTRTRPSDDMPDAFQNLKDKMSKGYKSFLGENSMKSMVETAISLGLAYHSLLKEAAGKKKPPIEGQMGAEVMKAAAAHGVNPKDALKKAKEQGAFKKLEESVWNYDDRVKFFEDWIKKNYPTEVIDGTPKN
jgi:hypothetical protein